jgi:uncharacterized protein with HEPN domain
VDAEIVWRTVDEDLRTLEDALREELDDPDRAPAPKDRRESP